MVWKYSSFVFNADEFLALAPSELYRKILFLQFYILLLQINWTFRFAMLRGLHDKHGEWHIVLICCDENKLSHE